MIRAVCAQLKIPDARRFSSHGLRMGDAREMKESGSPWVVVASDGVWNSPSFRGYLDMAKDVESGVTRLVGARQDSRPDAVLVDRWVYFGGSPLGRHARPLCPWVLGLSRAALRPSST